MTEEEKKAKETAEAAAAVEAAKKEKTDLEKAQDQLKKAEFTIQELKKANKKEEPEAAAATGEIDIEKLKSELKAEVLTEITKDGKTVEELRNVLASELGKNKGGSAASVKIEPEAVPTFTATEKIFVERMAQRKGISFEEAAKLFKK